MKIVIIGQNEKPSIIPMLESLKNVPAERIWVCDRCKDGSEELLKDLGEYTLTTPPELKGRQTSFSRNLGLSKAIGDDVLFLDGDRYLVKGDLRKLPDTPSDVTLLFLENDFRDDLKIADDYNLYYGRLSNFFYSCGLFMKKHAIERVCEFQGGELFSTEAQKDWGIEDTYLGDVCYSLGLSCSILPEIRLHGEFEKRELDSINVFRKRLQMRDKLPHVIW